jgi:arabinofuranan 3-O-arabinosyltransferase
LVAVGWSAVAFALVGGVNAVATGATLVLPAIWLITRRLDRSTLKVAVGWLGCVLAVSIWWLCRWCCSAGTARRSSTGSRTPG